MNLVLNQRLRKAIDYLKSTGKVYNDTDLCRKLGSENRSYLSEVLRGKRSLTPAFVNKIATVFTELNPQWLLDENCTQMLRDNVTVEGSHNTVNNGRDQIVQPGAYTTEQVNAFLSTIAEQQKQIASLLRIIENMQK